MNSHSLSACLKGRRLISIRRHDVDDLSIQGFLVGLSDSLVAIELVYDFQLDGITVLRRSDVSEFRRTGTDEFQERLMRTEGITPGTQGPAPLELTAWQDVIRQLAAYPSLVILERELGPAPQFAIGRVMRATAMQVEFQTFTGAGKWSGKTERLKYSQITCLQFGTRYLGFYQRYFERNVA